MPLIPARKASATVDGSQLSCEGVGLCALGGWEVGEGEWACLWKLTEGPPATLSSHPHSVLGRKAGAPLSVGKARLLGCWDDIGCVYAQGKCPTGYQHAPIRSDIYASMHSSVNSSVPRPQPLHPFTIHAFTCYSPHLLIRLSSIRHPHAHPPICPSVIHRPPTHAPIIHPPTHASIIQPSTHPPTYPSSIHLSMIHPSVCPSVLSFLNPVVVTGKALQVVARSIG